jgi:hypothetical protein
VAIRILLDVTTRIPAMNMDATCIYWLQFILNWKTVRRARIRIAASMRTLLIPEINRRPSSAQVPLGLGSPKVVQAERQKSTLEEEREEECDEIGEDEVGEVLEDPTHWLKSEDSAVEPEEGEFFLGCCSRGRAFRRSIQLFVG